MDADRWQQVKPILESALELNGSGRQAFLDQACANPSLRMEIESLLISHDEAGTGVLAPGSQLEANDEELRFRLAPGKRVGSYEILEEIAQGGMGAVYRAVRADGQYDQQVALKIVRADLGAELTAARFRNERQILASLDHPNIARILDGGTTAEGLPYFVMEFIDGLPIAEYCDRNKLSIDKRLKIFRTVCSAVHHAHQHLVIHRDIKPSNILITEQGVPKLLDFGIAKILDSTMAPENTTLTAAGIWLMTPEYASPEQLRGETITTASDVYSLGLVLYQLLTGHSAYHFKTRMPHEISRIVLECEPEKPSRAILHPEETSHGDERPAALTPELVGGLRGESPEKLQRLLTGDLDNIVMKAIRKEPSGRYNSVEQFSEDVRRHLEGLPITARKGTVAYRCQKFVSRHKPTVAAAALVLLSLIAGVALTAREARIARKEQARAEQRFKDVRELAHSLMFEIHDGIAALPGSTTVRQLLVNKALGYLDSLSQESTGDFSLQRELAAAYDRVGDLQWSVDRANQGDTVGSLRSYRKALSIRESLVAMQPKDSRLEVELVAEYFRLAEPLESSGDFRGALEVLRKAPPIIDRIAAQTSDPQVRDHQGGSYYYIARMLNQMGDPAGGLESYRKAAAIHAGTTTSDPRQAALLKTHLAGDNAGIAECLMVLGRLSEAIQVQEQAAQSLEELTQSGPTNTSLRGFLGNSYSLLGTIWKKQGNSTRALDYYRREREIFKDLFSADPANSLARVNLAFSDESVGETLVARGKVTEGVRSIREGLTIFEAMAAAGAKDRYVSSGIALSYLELGLAYSRLARDPKLPRESQLERLAEARSWYQKSSHLWGEKKSQGPLDYYEDEEAQEAAQGLAQSDGALAKAQAGR